MSHVEFLAALPPFDGLDADEVDAVAALAVEEAFRAGERIVVQGDAPPEHVRIVRTGGVEVVHDGRVLDLLGPGELFGHAAMLAGLPVGFSAVARDGTTVLRLPADALRPLLGRPPGLRYVTRSLLAPTLIAPPGLRVGEAPDPAQRPVRELIRDVLCLAEPEQSIRSAAQQMTSCGGSSVVVPLRDGTVGILTDRDLRTVIADGVDTAAPVRVAMTAPAWTVAADRLGGEVLLDMLDRGVRHVPVVAATGEILGVLGDADLVVTTTHSSFGLRSAIARAATVEHLVDASKALWPTVIAMHDARVPAAGVAGVASVVVDALTRRLIELCGPPRTPLTWLALGSLARREAMPSSDVDSALVWTGSGEAESRTLAGEVLGGLAACGFPVDTHGAVATNPLFARSYDGWLSATRSWLAEPEREKVPIVIGLVVDARPVWGVRAGPSISEMFRDARRHPGMLRMVRRYALAHRPPVGFLRDFVVDHGGRRRGFLDLKQGGLVPIVDLARWAGLAAGVTSASTPARPSAAADAGVLTAAAARTVEEAFHLVMHLRLTHQVEQLKAGEAPGDLVRPRDLGQVTRVSLREAFRAVAAVQKRIAAEADLGVR